MISNLMNDFKIKIEPEALDDIQQGINWYKNQKTGLGRRFHQEVNSLFNRLKTNPYFQIRYDNVRCLPLKTFPFMVHFTVDEQEKLIIIRAVFNTYRNPKKF